MNFFQVHQYSMPIGEKGTSYYEQIEIYENRGVEIFRVPAHNDVDAADFYHDFNMVSLVSIFQAGYLLHVL